LLGQRAWVHPTAVLIGRVKLGDEVSVWPMVTIRGDVNTIEVGARSNVQDGAVIHATGCYSHAPPGGYPTKVGEDVTIGHKALLHGCTISDRVLIGMGAIIMDGVSIEPDVIVAAGSLVPPGKVLTSGLWKGNPARFARELTGEELQFLPQSAKNYMELKDRYLRGDFQ